MVIFRKILGYFLIVIILICYHGFFFEKYICISCSNQHEEISFFEFGEKNHNHLHGNTSDCCTKNCICCSENHQTEHEKNSKVEYFSFKNLFSHTYKILIKAIISEIFINNNINFDYFYLNLYNSVKNINIITQIKTFKISDFISQFVGDINPYAAISVFRI